MSGKAKAMSREVWLFLFIVQPSQEVFPHFFRPEWSQDPIEERAPPDGSLS